MKREEKNVLSRQRILEAAMEEFSQKGYEGASLNTVCTEKGISKGIIYHYFRDKDELYLLCVEKCFDALTECLREAVQSSEGSLSEKLQQYFDARLCFFANHPQYLGIFADASFDPPIKLTAEIAARRSDFDELNISVLTRLLAGEKLREGLSVNTIVEDFRMYMDYFNIHFKEALRRENPEVILQSAEALREGEPAEVIMQEETFKENLLRQHEERCHRQLDILLYGVLGEKNEK